jgi:hypothetical protein
MWKRVFACSVLAIAWLCPGRSLAQAGARTLVLPLRSLGVNDTTLLVSRDLLVGSLEDLGLRTVADDDATDPLPAGANACDQAACAATLGAEHGAGQVVYGSLSKLGGKIIARLNVIRVGDTSPYYRDQLTATTEEDLDRVMRRFAEGIAAGRPNSDRASIESVTQAETTPPARRATRAGFGLRAGFLFPTGSSFGGATRLTNLHGAYRYELHDWQIETTTLVGLSWGDGNRDWTLLDLSGSRVFGTQDVSAFVGAGLGVHTVVVNRFEDVTYTPPPGYGSPYTYRISRSQTETAPTMDLVAGLLLLRTYDFSAVLEVRYHHVFADFNEVGGNGADGVLVTFGTSH